jgi:phosphonate transport system substrate-binding protein
MSGPERADRRRVVRGPPSMDRWAGPHLALFWYRRTRVALLILLLAFTCTTQAAPQSYSFGVVPQYDQRRLVAIWQPILDELTRRTGLQFTLTGVPQTAEFEKRFLAGQYDFAYMNPYHAALAARRQNYQMLVRDQEQVLCGLIVVRRDSPLHSPYDLAGKTVAFPSPNAIGASLLVRADLTRLFHVHITPRYVHTHTSVYLQVAQGLVEAGGGAPSTLAGQPESVRKRLRVIHTTTRVPSHPVMAHPRVPIATQNKVRQAFLDMGATRTGQALLARVPIQRIGTASAQDYALVEQLGLEEFYVDDSRDGGDRPRRKHAVEDGAR